MRLTKVFGLSVVTAITAMALFGASSASAMNTALCSSNEGGALTCAAGNQWKSVHAVATAPLILSSMGNLLCEKSLLEASLLGLAAPQVGHVKSLTFVNCKGAVPCTMTTTSLGTLSFLKTASNLGSMQFHNMKIFIKCSIFFECEYEGLPSFHLVGASMLTDNAGNGGIEGTKVGLTSNSPLDACPGAIFFDVFWSASAPVYVKT
jgi:hypothetical protein